MMRVRGLNKFNDRSARGGTLGQHGGKGWNTPERPAKAKESPSVMEHNPQSAISIAQQCEELHTYIMCGGGGTRLWPLSRADNPKQNLRLLNDNTMLGETIARINRVDIPELVAIINLMGNSSQCETMHGIRKENGAQSGVIISEPFGKNTAPAVTIACLHAERSAADDPYVLILPSDHVIEPTKKFSVAIANGLNAADAGQIVLFGVEPTAPVTGYGYIEVENQDTVSSVKSFKEKPDRETAQRYLETGKHLWNAGIFLFRASTMKGALEKHAPEILKQCAATLDQSALQGSQINLNPQQFEHVPADSIDFAVMEHADNISVVRTDFNWHDVGSFASLKNIQKSDENNNVITGDVIADDCTNSLLHSDGHAVAALGMDNISVVSTPDITLVAPLDRAEDIRKIVDRINKSGRRETQHSPWLDEAGAIPGSMADDMRGWLFDDALPFWLDKGLDHDFGGFHEVLDFKGNSIAADKRLRTMARQIYVYGKATELGWSGNAKRAIEHGLTFLAESAQSPNGGWYKTFDAQSNPLDLTEDAYDHAFILLALAQTQKAGIEVNPALLNRVSMMLETLRITGPDGRFNGYAEDTVHTLPRRSNPHMHLLEAMMAYYEASGDESYLDRADEIVSLFKTRFYDSDSLLLGESFDQDLQFTGGAVSAIEPGHQFEWAHLLHKFAALSDTVPAVQINSLFAHAKAMGINPVSGFAYDEISSTGKPKHYTSRCWVQTELLSCLCVLSENGKGHLRFQAERHAQNMWDRYINPAPKGMWFDVVDGRGNAVSKSVPASTFYHLINCIDHYTKTLG